MQEGEKLGHDVLYLIGDEHLIAVELNLVAVDVQVVLNLGEIEHARQMEGIIYVEVYPEQGLVGHWIEVAVEIAVVFVLER